MPLIRLLVSLILVKIDALVSCFSGLDFCQLNFALDLMVKLGLLQLNPKAESVFLRFSGGYQSHGMIKCSLTDNAEIY